MKKDGEICWVAPGSSVCLAVNSSDTAPVMVALGAEIVLRSLRVQRAVPAGAFFRNDGIAYLNKDPDELVTGVRLPSPNGWSATYVKLRRRGSIDFPVLGVAAWIKRDSPRGSVAEARVVLGAVASRPLEVPQAAQALIGRPLSEESIRDAAEAAFRPAKPMDNTDYALSWRKEMVRQFVGKALRRLM
jgi:4-hydroxybenzoyl-CoA reductase subunit beta